MAQSSTWIQIISTGVALTFFVGQSGGEMAKIRGLKQARFSVCV